MRLLGFLARRFAFVPHARTLADAAPAPAPSAIEDAVVVFVHAEARDTPPERRASTLEHARKHVEWLARKQPTKRVVLHSFAHLGGESADPEWGAAWIGALGALLAARGFEVLTTPFGWTNAWEMSVRGEGFAKVWKEF